MKSNGQQVVISMTSFPAALGYAQKAIRSLLSGSVLPDKLVLYLTASQFVGVDLPKWLRELQEGNPIFEVRYCDLDIRSYTKLIPALADFPRAVIVTVDDDVHYHRHMLRDLLALHAKLPNAVLAHRAKRIKPDKPYRKWPKYRWYDFLVERIRQRDLSMQTGVGGVLYPPASLAPNMLKPELFMSLAPTSDDIWFWAAASMLAVPIVPVPFGHNKPRGLGKPSSMDLKHLNFKGGEDRNAEALRRIAERFPEIAYRLNSYLGYEAFGPAAGGCEAGAGK